MTATIPSMVVTLSCPIGVYFSAPGPARAGWAFFTTRQRSKTVWVGGRAGSPWAGLCRGSCAPSNLAAISAGPNAPGRRDPAYAAGPGGSNGRLKTKVASIQLFRHKQNNL